MEEALNNEGIATARQTETQHEQQEKKGNFPKVLQSCIQGIAERLACFSRKDLSRTEKRELRGQCRQLEVQLGIETASQRALEASLFIDPPFLKTAILQDMPRPEELFGLEAWKGWLTARLAAKQMGSLTLEKIIYLHSLLTQGLSRNVPGQIRNEANVGGDYTNIGSPLILTEPQLEAVEQNPRIAFRPTTQAKREGLIVYPTHLDQELCASCLDTLPIEKQEKLKESPSTEALLRAMLEDTAEWYEQARPESSDLESNTAVVAELQRRIISIHPFRDGNGRLSRLILNWALERALLSSTILPKGEQDLLMGEAEWCSEVASGQEKYAWLYYDLHYNNPLITPQELFFGSESSLYYQLVFQENNKRLTDEELLNHSLTRARLQKFTQEVAVFRQETKAATYLEGERAIIGGLIPRTHIETWGSTKPESRVTTKGDRYYPDTDIYRGGVCEKPASLKDYLRLFTEPAGLTARIDL